MAYKVSEKGFKLEEVAVMPNQADSTADTVAKLVTDFNALLKKLQDAGLMAKGS